MSSCQCFSHKQIYYQVQQSLLTISKDPETLQFELELMFEKTEEPGEYSRKQDGENCIADRQRRETG